MLDISKTQKEECEEDIIYIQTNILSGFKFEISSAIDPDTTNEYFSHLHVLLSALIYTYMLKDMEQILISYIDSEVQQPEETINYLGKHCELKTLSFNEQFAVFRLLGENDVRTLLRLSMEDCDTFTYEAFLALIHNDDYNDFKKNACDVRYSALKVSRIAQAICIHSNKISDFLYQKYIDSLLQRIESYNKDFLSNIVLTSPVDYFCFSHLMNILPRVLGLHYGPVSSFIESFLFEYGALRTAKLLKIPVPSSIEMLFPDIVWFRRKMLEQYISYISDELNGNAKAEVETPSSVPTPPKSRNDNPTNATDIKKVVHNQVFEENNHIDLLSIEEAKRLAELLAGKGEYNNDHRKDFLYEEDIDKFVSFFSDGSYSEQDASKIIRWRETWHSLKKLIKILFKEKQEQAEKERERQAEKKHPKYVKIPTKDRVYAKIVNDFVFGPDEKKMTLSSIKNNSEEKGLNDNEIKILEIMVEEALDPE